MGHDPQPRVGQASDQAIKVRAGPTSPVTQHGQIPAKAPVRGQAIHESRTTRQTTQPCPASPRPATSTLTDGSERFASLRDGLQPLPTNSAESRRPMERSGTDPLRLFHMGQEMP